MRSLASRVFIVLILLVAAGLPVALAIPEAGAQAPPPRPKEKSEQEKESPPPKPKRRPGPTAPPPPKLVISADVDCSLELDGEPLGELERDEVQEFRIRQGEHLLQASPKGIGEEAPIWKESVKAPETGNVVVTVELQEIIEEWREKTANQDRFEERADEILDRETGLVWARNVSPAMRWDDVSGYCQQKTIAGHTGWRMPTIDELSKLYWPDHPAPQQESIGGESRWTILGKRTSDIEVLPRLIFEPFEHNSVGALWARDEPGRVACSFLGEFNCSVERKKADANALCVRPREKGS